MERKVTGVYIMQSSNGLCKIGKANNVETRRMQLEQNANMFNLGEKVTLEIIAFYPVISEAVAFALESHLQEHLRGKFFLSIFVRWSRLRIHGHTPFASRKPFSIKSFCWQRPMKLRKGKS